MRGLRSHRIASRDIDHVFTHEGDAGVRRLSSVDVAGEVYNQANKLAYFGGNVNHNTGLPMEVDWRIRNAWCSARKYTLELCDRPTFPQVHHPDAKSRGSRDNAARLCHVEPAYGTLRHTAPCTPQISNSLHQLVK